MDFRPKGLILLRGLLRKHTQQHKTPQQQHRRWFSNTSNDWGFLGNTWNELLVVWSTTLSWIAS
jgi:hypothetical protein